MALNVDDTGIPNEILREIEETDAQVVLERNGEAVAVLVSPRLLSILQELADELENRLDLAAYRRAKQEFVESGEDAIPYETFRKNHDL